MSYSNALRFSDSASLDAFGRLRTSNPYTLFDSKQIFDNAPLFWDDAQTTGSGTSSTYNTNQASTTIAVSNLTAGTRVRQTKRRFNYQSGKSQLILMTGILGSGSAGITKRIGYFDENNGLFFELLGTTLSVVRRTKTSGSVVDNKVARASWNIDKLDGTGNSGITLDLTKTQIFFIDYEWLGVGRVRLGFVIDGLIFYCHEFLNSNVLSLVYMSTPNLPCRYEISNDGTGGVASVLHICASVMSEGGQEDTGVVLSTSSENTPLAANANGTTYAAIGFRLKSTHLAATIINLSMSVFASTVNDYYEWKLLLNPTVAGSFTYNGLTNSALEIANGVTANTVSGGTLLNSGYCQQQASITSLLTNSLNIGSTIAGVSDTIVFCIMPISGSTNVSVFSSLTWRELI